MSLKLSAEERDILKKLTIKELDSLHTIIEKEQANPLLKVMNLLIESDRDYFLLYDVKDEKELMKRHTSFRAMLLGFKKIMRIIKAAEHEIATRKEKKDE